MTVAAYRPNLAILRYTTQTQGCAAIVQQQECPLINITVITFCTKEPQKTLILSEFPCHWVHWILLP